MHLLHERLWETVVEERDRAASRRQFLSGSAKVAGAAALAGVAGLPGLRGVSAQDAFESDVDVLNYALTLEHLEHAFYRDGLDALGVDTFEDGPFGEPLGEYITAIRDHEAEHVDALTQTITDLDGEAVSEAEYTFEFPDVTTFLATAAILENVGVQAYDGAGQFISDPALLTVAGTIVAVEARHASYLNLITGVLPFPAAVETPLAPADVLAAAGQFIAAEGTPETGA